jgi:hypothetical protein
LNLPLQRTSKSRGHAIIYELKEEVLKSFDKDKAAATSSSRSTARYERMSKQQQFNKPGEKRNKTWLTIFL